MSSVLKAPLRRVDISKYKPRRDASPFEFWTSCKSCTSGTRLPPQLPDRVAYSLANEKSFYSKADVETVANLYRSFFETVTPSQMELCFANLGWGPSEAKALAQVLPYFKYTSSS